MNKRIYEDPDKKFVINLQHTNVYIEILEDCKKGEYLFIEEDDAVSLSKEILRWFQYGIRNIIISVSADVTKLLSGKE